jgi:hypothetical protein
LLYKLQLCYDESFQVCQGSEHFTEDDIWLQKEKHS